MLTSSSLIRLTRSTDSINGPHSFTHL